MVLADVHNITRYRHWRLFGTGTWSSAGVPGESAQTRLLFAFLYETAKLIGIPFRRLVWVVRRERGEQFGRLHFHWLIGGPFKSHRTLCFQLNRTWDNLPRCGFSRNYVFDCARGGAEYITECLSGLAIRDGASQYEAGKFGWSDNEVIPSKSFLLAMCGGRLETGLGDCKARTGEIAGLRPGHSS
jgi:hypothetical protein